MKLATQTYTGCAMGAEVMLSVVTDDARAGDEALRGAVRDLEETEQALSRFRKNSDLSVLNREGRLRLDTLSRDGIRSLTGGAQGGYRRLRVVAGVVGPARDRLPREVTLRIETYPIVGERIHKHLLAVGVR